MAIFNSYVKLPEGTNWYLENPKKLAVAARPVLVDDVDDQFGCYTVRPIGKTAQRRWLSSGMLGYDNNCMEDISPR